MAKFISPAKLCREIMNGTWDKLNELDKTDEEKQEIYTTGFNEVFDTKNLTFNELTNMRSGEVL